MDSTASSSPVRQTRILHVEDQEFKQGDNMDMVFPTPSSWTPSGAKQTQVFFDEVVPMPLAGALGQGATHSRAEPLVAPSDFAAAWIDHLGDESSRLEARSSGLDASEVDDSSVRDRGIFFASISDPEQALRFPEFHKIRNALLPLLNEETTLDSDLRCLLRSKFNNEETRNLVEVYLPAFEAGLDHMRAQETYFADLYCKCPGNFGAAEVAIVRCRLKWAEMRLRFKRQFLYVLVNGGYESTSAFSPAPADISHERSTCTDMLQPLQHRAGRPDKLPRTVSFVASGVAKPRSNFSKAAKAVLRAWFEDHRDNPYPSDDEKDDLARQTGLAASQVSTWFINERMRNWRRKRKHLDACSRDIATTNKMRRASSSGAAA